MMHLSLRLPPDFESLTTEQTEKSHFYLSKLSSVQISCGAPGHRGLYDFQQTQTKRRLQDHWVLFVQNGGKDEEIWLCLGTESMYGEGGLLK